MMRRHHENRILFDFPGMESKTSLLSQLKPSPRSTVTLPLCLSRKFGVSLGKSRGGNALSLLEVKEPRGSLCVFGNFLHIRKLPRCGARSSTKRRFDDSSVRSKVPNFSLLPRNKAASSFSFCGLMPPTLALTFLLREKSAKAYPRGGVLLDISSGGSIPHSHFVTFPLFFTGNVVINKKINSITKSLGQ